MSTGQEKSRGWVVLERTKAPRTLGPNLCSMKGGMVVPDECKCLEEKEHKKVHSWLKELLGNQRRLGVVSGQCKIGLNAREGEGRLGGKKKKDRKVLYKITSIGPRWTEMTKEPKHSR